MSSTLKCIGAAALLLLLCAAAFFVGRWTVPGDKVIEERERIDTLVIRDTITRVHPVHTYTHTRDTIEVTLREVVHDTVRVYLPREVKVYEDSLYRAEVSGYQPNLDKIDIYQQTQIITRDVTQVVKKKTRWGVGLQVGYGATYYDGRLRGSPYVGVGVSWNIIAW